MDPSAVLPDIAGPPRAIPPGVRLRIFASRDIVGSLFSSIPAAFLLSIAALAPATNDSGDMFVRMVFFVMGSAFLMLAFMTAIPPLRRALRTLHRMENGVAAVGRVASCRYAFQRKHSARPYAEFLGDWRAIGGGAVAAGCLGCVASAFLIMFVTPIVLLMLAFAAAGVAGLLWDPARVVAAQVDFVDAAKAVLGLAALALGVLLWARFWRWFMGRYLRRYMDDDLKRHRERLRQQAREDPELAAILAQAAAANLKDPLPPDTPDAVPIVCSVQHRVTGETVHATARAAFTNRLKRDGVEPLLVDPDRPGEVDLIDGLPTEIRLSSGQWQPLPQFASAFWIVAAAVIAGLATAAFVSQLPMLAARALPYLPSM